MAVYKVGIVLFTNCFIRIYASYHWIVTETGRIASQVDNSGFPLKRHDDLLAFLEQEQRLDALNHLYKQLISLKKSIDNQWSQIESEGDLEKRLYSTDIDCLLGEIPLSQHNLFTEFLDYGHGSRPKMKEGYQPVEPDCTAYSELDFSMRTFPHLETLNKRNNNLTVNSVPSKTILNFNIDAMLQQNNSDWTAYNIASLYWRTVGNGTNAVECARRALYFSPRHKRHIVLLNLGTLLQELHSLGEAAIILHSAVDHDPIQPISHLALGNVYTALGDYKRSLACYDNVLSLNPENIQALQLKHALLCHKKLESGLLEIHSSLDSILQNLEKHNAMHEQWLILRNQVNWERDSNIKEFLSLSSPIYLQMLLQNKEHQVETPNENKKTKKFHRKSEKEKTKTLDLTDEKISHCVEKKLEADTTKKEMNCEREDTEMENLINSEYLLKNKIHSIINFIKSNYEQDVSSFDSKKISKQLNFLNELNQLSHYLIDRSLVINNFDSCVKDSDDVKKLN